MVYLAVFHWGWLAGSLLLGFAMGWIAVVHRGRGVTKRTAQWLSVLAAALIVAALTHVVPGRFGYWLDLGLVMFGLSCGLRDRLVAARPGGLAPGGGPADRRPETP